MCRQLNPGQHFEDARRNSMWTVNEVSSVFATDCESSTVDLRFCRNCVF